MSISNNKTSHLISSQVPNFVRDDHGRFVEFLEEYYRFLEQEGQVNNTTKNLLKNKDIDQTEEVYVKKLYETFLALLPEHILADRTLILKHVKDFYRAKGTEKSVRFLMRILFNKEVEFYYPKRDVLKTSDGKWFIEKSVRVGNIQVNNTSNSIAYTQFTNRKITGISSGATATVESIDKYYDKGQLVTELKLSGEYRSFEDGEGIFCLFEEGANTNYLSANLFSGVVVAISLSEGGSGYIEGASVPIEGDGSGAQVIISSTTKGALSSIGVSKPGAGFRSGDKILITGGGGTGAAAEISAVDLSGRYHPNSYSIVGSTINLEANTPINNVRYSNLQISILNPYTDSISNSMTFWTYDNCGPTVSCQVTVGGQNYTVSPTLDALSNTAIRSLGILGRLEIVNGGLNYQVGDELVFTNPFGCFGTGAKANVTNVAANGCIQAVSFQKMPGHIIGGSGYDSVLFPSITVSSNTGSGANIMATAILCDNESLVSSSLTYGKIQELRLVSGGSGYTTPPKLNLAAMASGSGAQAAASIVSGAFTYPGRFINEDGFLSSYNFIQDRDYYQNYSYVIRIDEPVVKYKHILDALTHPAGTRMFGHYLYRNRDPITPSITNTQTVANSRLMRATYTINVNDVTKTGTYNVTTRSFSYRPVNKNGTYNIRSVSTGSFVGIKNNILLYYPGNSLKSGDNVFLKFHTNQFSNITNGMYSVYSANQDYLIVPVANSNTSLYAPPTVTSNLTLSTGIGNTNAYTTLSRVIVNSNVTIDVGDMIVYGSNISEVLSANTSGNILYLSPALVGNLTNKVFSVKKKPYAAYGNVSIIDPIVRILADQTELVPGDNVFLKFSSSDSSLINTSYTVIDTNSSLLTVSHKDIANSVSMSGNVTIYFNRLIMTANGHGLKENETIFAIFTSGDTANAVNSQYIVDGITTNTFNVSTNNPVSNSGVGYMKTANISLVVTNHNFGNTENVYVWFTSGDTANITNGLFTTTKRDANTVFFDTQRILTSNGTIVVYRNYSNVSITRTGHGLNPGDLVNVLFDTGDLANIGNGVFTVTSVANSNTFNIKHTDIKMSDNLSSLFANNTGIVYVT